MKPIFSISNNYRRIFHFEQDACLAIKEVKRYDFFGDFQKYILDNSNFTLRCPFQSVRLSC